MAPPEQLLVTITSLLCNIDLLTLTPKVPPKIKEMIRIGGVFYRKSEIITLTECNAFCDPEILKIVLDSECNDPNGRHRRHRASANARKVSMPNSRQ